MTVARALLFNAAFYLWTLAMMLWALVASIGQPRRVQRVVPVWSRASLWLLARITGLTHEVVGYDRLPPAPFIVAAKHQSAWDVLALTVLFPEAGFVLKQELRRLPLFGYLAARAGHIAVNRGGHARALTAMLAAVRDAVTRGRSIIVFPQGTRTQPGETRPYRVGVAALYAELGVPVVPVALNSGLYWPRRWPIQRAGTIRVEILPPIFPGLERRAFLVALASTIEEATGRLEAEARAAS
ncbi:MAG: 1-acyl-sn-glycerol-3-phosphate acyltransferase [Alphaproteobacteria bacterium]|nr:1-acyl-sn-glycerol-3-phosphate acyltransferase [Alphaproteobacteria bacterium]